jgi:hypothetical protein
MIKKDNFIKYFIILQKKKDRERLDTLFSGTYIVNMTYYYVFEENVIPWEFKIK